MGQVFSPELGHLFSARLGHKQAVTLHTKLLSTDEELNPVENRTPGISERRLWAAPRWEGEVGAWP